MSGGYNRMRTDPIPVQRTTRNHDLRVLSSLPAGRMVPVAAIPMLREDSIAGANMRFQFEMGETVEVLMNAVNVRVMAYLVPNLAFERFTGLDDLNRSYQGVPARDGEPVTPFFETMTAPAHGANKILLHMGKHARPGTTISTAYIEAYNLIWNMRAKNRSPNITPRTRLQSDLAPAFWMHNQFEHIVPDFDQALLDGEVALNVVNSKMPVRGIGFGGATGATGAIGPIEPGNGTTASSWPTGYKVEDIAGAGKINMYVKGVAGQLNATDVWAELQDNGITVSLSNIEMARRTQAFANLRRQYNGHSDDYIIDLLMEGISVPEQAWHQPILLADENTIFGMSKRYASDAGNLTESVVNGATSIDVRFSVPRVPMGGVVMLVAEVTPEQMFERQKDPYLHTTSVATLPNFLRDTLDPEKVEAVPCEYVDLDHDTPNDTFGYAPLGYQWANTAPQIGGRFYRPAVDASFDEDRQRLWAVETQNPVLSQDFYLCTTMHYKPFVITSATHDPFEVLLRGNAVIRGNTVFGGALIEATNDYEKIVAEQPTERLNKA